MIDEGIVKEFGETKSKTPKVFIQGKQISQWLVAGKVDISHLDVGQKVAFQYHPWEDNKKVLLLDSWALVPHQPGAAERANGALNQAPNAISKDEYIFICGVVNHAIDVKLINAHTDLSTWVKAAVDALRHFEDRIPYSDPEEP